MSRIHEALKKAEQERTGKSGGGSPSMDAGRSKDHQDSVSVATSDALMQQGMSFAPSDGPLQFSDIDAQCARHKWHPSMDSSVFSDANVSGGAAEQFRTLRSRLYQLKESTALRTILVTSAVPGDGKTFVTHNLAQAIVRQPDRRALIIDADLRVSRLHIPLGAPRVPGLSDYLSGGLEETAVMQRGQASDLFLIPGGNVAANPSELLSNGRLKHLLDRVAPAFDWVFFDSPPCLPVADASVIADLCDGILLVVRSGATPLASAQKACQELQGKNVIGVVLNNVEANAFSYSSYYGSAYDGGNESKLRQGNQGS